MRPLCWAPPPLTGAGGGGSRHLVVATRNRQDVPRDGPADVPNDVVELVQQLGRPRVPRRVVARPDEDASVLQRLTTSHTCGGGGLGWRPGDASSPGSSWRWCWWGARWKGPSPRPSPSHCEPPASGPPSTDRLPPWRGENVEAPAGSSSQEPRKVLPYFQSLTRLSQPPETKRLT